MIPVFGGQIVERQQRILIFRQAVDCLGILRVILFDEDGIAISAEARLGAR